MKTMCTRPLWATCALLLGLFLTSLRGFGQTVIARQDFETSPATPTWTFTTSDVGSLSAATGFTSTATTASDAPSGVNTWSEGSRGYRINANGSSLASRALTFAAVNTSGYSGVSCSFRVAGMSIGSTGNGMESGDEVLIEVSPDGGTTYYQQAKVVVTGSNVRWSFGATGSGSRAYLANNTFSSFTTTGTGTITSGTTAITTATITGLPSVSSLRIRITASNNAANESWIIDDVRISGTVIPPPVISAPSPTGLTGFNTTQGTPSASQSFTVTGSNLTANMDASAPSGYELHNTTLGAGYSSTLSFTPAQASGGVSIDVRLTGASVGSPAGDISITSTGATGQIVTVSGTVAASGSPLLMASPGLVFGSVCTNTTSASQNFTITGSTLTNADVTVGPLSGYLFQDVTGGGTFQTSLSIAQAGGSFSRTIAVEFAPTMVQSYNGNVPVGGGGASSVSIAVTGDGINTAPSTTTGASSAITAAGATLAGNITATGCTAISAYGIEYSSTNGFADGAGTQAPSSNLSAGAFSSIVSGLNSCTTYYYKAYATNDAGTTYGTQGSFITNNVGAPTATTATSIGDNGFTATWGAVAGATSYRLDVSTSSTFGTATPATDLFFSEYVEGSGSNKYIEIFNGTGASINLSNYRLRLYANGTSSPTNDVVLSGTLADGATVVYQNSGASAYAGATIDNSAVNYNGDDAIALFKISTNANVDIFGQIGNDPGSAWTSGAFTTVDKTLVRKSTVYGGVTVNPTGFPTLATEWDQFNTDDVSHLGAHSFNSFTPSYVLGYENLAVSGTSQAVTGLASSTTYHYRVRAVGGTCTSASSNVIDVTTTTPCVPVTITNTTSNSPICTDETLTLGVTVSGTGPFLYEWTGTGTITNDDQANASVTGAATGNYHILVLNDCGDAGADVAVTVNTPTTWYADADGDGLGDPAMGQSACTQPVGYVADNSDGCPNDATKGAPGACGCGVPDVATTYYADTDGDGFGDPASPLAGFTCTVPPGYVANNTDQCIDDPAKQTPGACGCGSPDVATTYYADTDGDGFGDPASPLAGFTCTVPPGHVTNNTDQCIDDPAKQTPGACGCGVADTDTDGDGVLDCFDGCPNDPEKVAPGVCGCGVADDDQDFDGVADCNDACPNDPDKINPGSCGCGNPEPGTACDDGNADTGNDVISAGCVCTGTPIDCLGEIGGTATIGSACDDGDAGTFGDVYNADCDCVGTSTDCSDGDPCTFDFYDGNACVSQPSMDSDLDGTCDLLDECPNDPDKIAAGACGCGVADTDSDSDGTPDCNDGCPSDPSKTNPGQCGCGVVDVDTDGDLFADCIDACPSDPLKISPGQCGCGTIDLDGDGDGVANCIDACPNDPNKIAPGICGCGVADTDSDGDLTADCNDGCPNDANKIAPGVCGCGVADTDTDSDGVADCNDNCPNVPGVMGSTCDDGDPSSINDVLNASCVCAGTVVPPCSGNNLAVVMTTDAHGEQTSWEIVPQSGGAALCSGGVLPSNTTITTPCCVPDGCYVLHVFDSFGDGMTTGGYVVRDGNNARVIDNTGNGMFGSESQIANNNGFCLPTGTDHMMAASCDQLQLTNASILRCEPNPAVMALYGTGNQNDDGYSFHIFDPNGSYSRKILIANSNASTGGPAGPTRSSYLKISSMVTLPVPQFKLLNIRVASVVNGVMANYGPVCLMKIDPSNACQTTQLTTVGTPQLPASCGATNIPVPGGKITANEVPGATTYMFQFVAPGYVRSITSTTRTLTIGRWLTLPLSCGTTYDVRVRASLDNGMSFCAYGAVCQVTTSACARPDARSVDAAMAQAAAMKLWPNPNSGEQLHVALEGLDATLTTVSVDVMDLLGKRVMGRTLPVAEGQLNTVLQLGDAIGSGVYLLQVTAGEKAFTQRVVVQK